MEWSWRGSALSVLCFKRLRPWLSQVCEASFAAVCAVLGGTGADATEPPKTECVHARTGLALPRASCSGEITLAGSRLRSTLAAALAIFAHAVVTAAKNK